ncbi:MAG TPA: hypothetical protein VIZ65_04715 [Cellvibrionaceae bacterium]
MKFKYSVLLSAAICISTPATANTLFTTLDNVNATTDTYFLNFTNGTFGAVVDKGDGEGELLRAFWDNNQLVFPTVGFLTYEPSPTTNGSLISFATNNHRQTLNDLYFRDTGNFIIEPQFGYQIDSIDYQINFSGGNNGLDSGIYLNGGVNSSDVHAQWAAGSFVHSIVPGQLTQIENQHVQTTLTFSLPNLGEVSMQNDATTAELPSAVDGSTQEVFGNSSISINQHVFRQSDGTDSFIGGVQQVFLSTLVAEGNVSGIGSFSGALGIESIRMQVNTSRIVDSVISVPWPSMLWLWVLGLPITALLAGYKKSHVCGPKHTKLTPNLY